MQWDFPHRIEYEASARSIDDVISTLLAQKRLAEHGADLVCALAGIDLERVEIQVQRVEAGSLLQEILVQIYGSYQAQIEDKIIDEVEGMLGVDIPKEWEPLIALGSLAVTYLVMRFAYDAVRGKRKDLPPPVHIEGDYNTVITNIASCMNVDPERVSGVLEVQLPPAKRRSLISTATGFLSLARRNRGTKIVVDGYGDVSPETIAEYPSDADLSEIDVKKNLDLPATIIEIRALDKDRSKTGWAAKVVGDDRFKARLPMDLYPTVDGEELAKHERVQADVILEGETLTDGKFKAKRIHLLNFIADDNKDE